MNFSFFIGYDSKELILVNNSYFAFLKFDDKVIVHFFSRNKNVHTGSWTLRIWSHCLLPICLFCWDLIVNVSRSTADEKSHWCRESAVNCRIQAFILLMFIKKRVMDMMLNLWNTFLYNQLYIFTDGSKHNDKTACAAISNKTITRKAFLKKSPIFTAETCAIDLALNMISESNHKNLFSDSIPVLLDRKPHWSEMK